MFNTDCADGNSSTGKRGRKNPGRDKNVTRFPEFARLAFPSKTAAQLAAIGGRDERTAKRWLACECEPPFAVSLAIISEMHRPVRAAAAL